MVVVTLLDSFRGIGAWRSVGVTPRLPFSFFRSALTSRHLVVVVHFLPAALPRGGSKWRGNFPEESDPLVSPVSVTKSRWLSFEARRMTQTVPVQNVRCWIISWNSLGTTTIFYRVVFSFWLPLLEVGIVHISVLFQPHHIDSFMSCFSICLGHVIFYMALHHLGNNIVTCQLLVF